MTLHQGRIIFVAFVVRMENKRLPKCVILGGAGMQEKEYYCRCGEGSSGRPDQRGDGHNSRF